MILHESYFNIVLNQPYLSAYRKDVKDEGDEERHDEEGR